MLRKTLLAYVSALAVVGSLAALDYRLADWPNDRADAIAHRVMLAAGLFGATNASSQTKYTQLQIQTSAQGVPITLMWGKNRVTANLIWYSDFASHKQSGKGGGGKGLFTNSGSYTYTAAIILALCEGPIQGIGAVWVDQTMYVTGGLTQLGLSICGGMAGPPYGTAGQPVWPWLATNHPAEGLSYAYTAYLSNDNYQLGSSGGLPNHSFEVVGQFSSLGDASPADIIPDFLTNPQYSIGLPSSTIDATSLAFYRTYVFAQNIFMSPVLGGDNGQEQVSQILDRWAALTNSWIFWSGGSLKFVPLGDSAISSGGNNYTPNLTVQYALTYDDFIAPVVKQGAAAGDSASKTGDGGPIQVTRLDPADCPNHVKIEIKDRGNSYNAAPVEWQDQSLVDQFGQIDSPVAQAHEITDLNIGLTIAQLLLQRAAYIRNTYAFKLGYEFSLLEPGDLVSLTDVHLGLNRFPVRIRTIDEAEDGVLSLVAEEFPGAIGTSP